MTVRYKYSGQVSMVAKLHWHYTEDGAPQAKSGTIPLPPPPEEVERQNNKNKKKKNQIVGSQAPASFRRMMRVKVPPCTPLP